MTKSYIFLFTILALLSPHLPAEPTLNIAVFCSADDKVSDHFKKMAYCLGKQLGLHHYGLVTGGSKTGLMKQVTDGYIASNAPLDNLYGVMPQVLASYNIHHGDIPEKNLKWADTMHLRLALYQELADVIVVLPGGFGTLHELMDFLVHNQFDLIKKPIFIINSYGFWDHLLMQFQTMVDQQLLSPKHLMLISVVDSEEECIKKLLHKEFIYCHEGLQSQYWQR